MNSLGDPTCLDDLEFLRACPALRPALEAGDFRPGWFYPGGLFADGPAESVARCRQTGIRAVDEFFVQRMTRADGTERWHAYGEYCPFGRMATDACYGFLDGGGSFNTRETAEWAIHLYLAHRQEWKVMKEATPYGRI